MKAVWNELIVAESDNTVIVESNHYFPIESIDKQYFEASDHTSFCPWKGTANYYNLKVNGEINKNAVWYYASPKEAAKEIKNRVAFWKGVKVVE